MQEKLEQFTVGLDISSGWVRMVVLGHTAGEEGFRVLGCAESKGPDLDDRGMPKDSEALVDSIKTVCGKGGKHAGRAIERIYCNIATSAVELDYDCTATTEVNSSKLPRLLKAPAETSVSKRDIQRLDNNIYKGKSGSNVIHIINGKYYTTDKNKHEVTNPEGITGCSELTLHSSRVVAEKSVMGRLGTCVKRADLDLDGFFPSVLASAQCILEGDQKDLGVCFIDIGESSTDIAIYYRERLRAMTSIAYGTRNIVESIAREYGVRQESARNTLWHYGCAHADMAGSSSVHMELIKKSDSRPTVQVSRRTLAKLIQENYSQLLTAVLKKRNTIEHGVNTSMIVLSGPGVDIEGSQEIAAMMFDKTHVSCGRPDFAVNNEGYKLDTRYTTAAGVARCGFEKMHLLPPQYSELASFWKDCRKKFGGWVSG